MKLRQGALESAREMWADYLMVGQYTVLLIQMHNTMLFLALSQLLNYFYPVVAANG